MLDLSWCQYKVKTITSLNNFLWWVLRYYKCQNVDEETRYWCRKALANALAAAPSMWTLGNAGMGALQVIKPLLQNLDLDGLFFCKSWLYLSHWKQRLAQDSNPAIAAAASRAIFALKKQWEVEEGDSLRFMMNLEKPTDDDDYDGESDHDEIWRKFFFHVKEC